MINVIYNLSNQELLDKQKEQFETYCKIIQWGRKYPDRFIEQFLGVELLDHQRYVIMSTWAAAVSVWLMSRSSGKAEVLDTPVYYKVSDRGDKYQKKTIGDLKVGDLIYDESGELTEVIHLNPIIFDDVYEVEFEDGEKIQCNGDHLWGVYDRSFDKWNRYDDKYVLRSTDFLYCHFNDRFKDDNSKDYRFHVQIAKPINYPKYSCLSINPYLLGLWLGDGSSDAPCITSDGKDVDEIISYIAPFCSTIKKERDKRNCYRIFIDRKKEMTEEGYTTRKIKNGTLIAKLRVLNVFQNKNIPERYLYASIEDRLELLRGLMDSDGTIDKSGHCEFTQTNKKLMDDVCVLLTSLGIKYTLSYKEHTSYIKKDGTEAYTWRLYFTASKEMPIFKLKRKYNRLSDVPLRNADQKAIINVHKIGEKKAMRCITVNNKSGLYLCGNHATVTHNSFLSAPYIMARSILIPNHKSYIMAPAGAQAQETFMKMENLAKGNIASALGTTSVFTGELIRGGANPSGFTHDKNSYHCTLFNGSEINSLNSVAKNIVGVR